MTAATGVGERGEAGREREADGSWGSNLEGDDLEGLTDAKPNPNAEACRSIRKRFNSATGRADTLAAYRYR